MSPGARTRSLRRWGSAAALFVAALAVRVPYLGAVPSPAGDEGNWVTFGLAYFRGGVPSLGEDAGFVTTLYARLIALAYVLFGVSFAAARSVCALGTSLAAPAVYALALRVGMPRAGLVAGLVLALHPWSVAWSRSASVPYALAFALLACALALSAQVVRRPRGVALVAAAQLFSLGFHFTPLAACALPGVAYSARRAKLPRGALALAVALACVHPLMIVAGARRALASTSAPGRPLAHFAAHFAGYLRVCVECVSGQATLAHFTPFAWGPPARVLAGALCGAALARSLRRRDPLARVARAALVSSFFTLPLLLARGRSWHLPTIDAERYGFVFVAPFALLLGSLAQSRRGVDRAVAYAALASVVALGTVPLAYGSLSVGGPDRGLTVEDGGGAYRGHRISFERTPLAEQVVSAVRADARGAPALLVYRDYAFHPVGLAMYRDDPAGVLRRARAIPSELRADERVYVLAWAPQTFAPDFTPRAFVDENTAHRALALATPGASLVRTWSQPDRTPLLELWSVPSPSRANAR